MKIGDSYEWKKVIEQKHTAQALGSGGLPVFATPYMIAMMEAAALRCIQSSLPEGKSSVGTKVQISHLSPTPVGMEVRVRAEVISISENGKMIEFQVNAYDKTGQIGTGTHQRAIVDIARFTEKCQAKLDK